MKNNLVETVEYGFRHRDAIRLLFILCAGSEEITSLTQDIHGASRVFQSEKRVMAIDFLIRYPDYLADALLDRFEIENDQNLLKAAIQIFEAEEPSLRLVNMVRWNFGAYQSIEMSLSILSAFGLVRPMKLVNNGSAKRYDFYIFPKAFDFLSDAVDQVPALAWYRDRVSLAMIVASAKSGSQLKEWQYSHRAYNDTPHGGFIPTIQNEVKRRLEKIVEKNT